ncbi:MAG: hypothetical protein II479_04055 [Bacteroidales bacterium]|nr:hypothetical protein [Bacteroidales bacterium]
MRKMTLTGLLLAAALPLAAQRPSDFQQMELETLLQPFSKTVNAAGMGLAQPSPGSLTGLGIFREAGDFHLAQQGDADLGFTFSTLRYDSFSDKLFMRGAFSYTLDREKDRKWSDVMDPWFSSPYIFGSAVAKDYDSHDCRLAFDLYTAPLSDIVSLGIKTDYRVADISGKRDPRPRTGFLDYQLVPSVLLSFGPHRAGLGAGYGHSKEKLSGLTTIQSYPNLYYYKMSGLDHLDGAIAAYSGFKRQFVGDRFLAELSYAYTGGDWTLLAAAGAEYRNQFAYGDKMQTPGSFNYLAFNAQADLTVRRAPTVHHLRLEGNCKDAGADEYLQELTAVKDPVTGATTETWETLYVYRNRYMLKTWDATASYALFGGWTGRDYRWKAGARAGLQGFDKAFYLPQSGFSAAAWTAELSGAGRIAARRGHRLDLSAAVRGRLPQKVTLDLQENNLYTREVLEPDRDYYAAKSMALDAGLCWQFPLNLGKAGLASGYVRLDGGLCKTSDRRQWSRVELAVGLFTF